MSRIDVIVAGPTVPLEDEYGPPEELDDTVAMFAETGEPIPTRWLQLVNEWRFNNGMPERSADGSLPDGTVEMTVDGQTIRVLPDGSWERSLKIDGVEFHLKGTQYDHNQQDHGNRSGARTPGDILDEDPTRFAPIDWLDDADVQRGADEFAAAVTEEIRKIPGLDGYTLATYDAYAADSEDINAALEWQLLDATGEDVFGFKFQREVGEDDGTIYTEAKMLVLPTDLRRQGLGTVLRQAWEDQAAASGVDEVRVKAADEGRRVWARAGYDYDPVGWRSTGQKLGQAFLIAGGDRHFKDADLRALGDRIYSHAKNHTPGDPIPDWVPTPWESIQILEQAAPARATLDPARFMPEWQGSKPLLTPARAAEQQRQREIDERQGTLFAVFDPDVSRRARLEATRAAYDAWWPTHLAEADGIEIETEDGSFHLQGRHNQDDHGNWALYRMTGHELRSLTPDEYADVLDRTASIQRGEPESAMNRLQEAGSGVYPYMAEHIGDLTHRINERGGVYGVEFVAPKVDRAIATLDHPYGFEREMGEQIAENIRYRTNNPGSWEPVSAEGVAALGQAYADAHRKVPVFNEPSWYARRAAIALGEQRFDDARRSMYALQRLVKDPERYAKAMSQEGAADWLDSFGYPINEQQFRFNPDQPRVPAGNPNGGQWTDIAATIHGLVTDPPWEIQSLVDDYYDWGTDQTETVTLLWRAVEAAAPELAERDQDHIPMVKIVVGALLERGRVRESTQVASESAMYPDEEIEAAVAAQFAMSNVSMRVTLTGLEGILSDNEFKSQFETNTSNGSFAPETRARAELMLFGYDTGMDSRDRPIYGYMDVYDTNDIDPRQEIPPDLQKAARGQLISLSQYGNIRVEFKPEVRNRTTFTFSDSLSRRMIPSSIKDPQVESMVNWTESLPDLRNGDPFSNVNDYVEAQIHGHTTLDDVQRVVFPGPEAPPYITEQLNALGIDWDVMYATELAAIIEEMAVGSIVLYVDREGAQILDAGEINGRRYGKVVRDGHIYEPRLLEALLVRGEWTSVEVENTSTEFRYDPNQPRVPAGSSEGGRWTDGGATMAPLKGFHPVDKHVATSERQLYRSAVSSVRHIGRGASMYVVADGPDGPVPIRLDKSDAARTSLQDQADMLNALADAYEFAPTPEPPEIKIPSPYGWKGSQRTMAYVVTKKGRLSFAHEDQNEIWINEDPQVWDANTEKFHRATSMPAAQNVSLIDYTMAHEYGHVRHAQQVDDRTTMEDLGSTLGLSGGLDLSEYGRSNFSEAHAEAWAEWAVTRGGTDSGVARLYAAEFGWPGAPDVNRLLEDQLVASGIDMDEFLRVPAVCMDGPDGPSYIFEDDDSTEFAYDPNQPRVPAGSAEGGQWTDGDSTTDSSATRADTAPDSPDSEPTSPRGKALRKVVDASVQEAWFAASDDYDINGDYAYEAYEEFEDYDGSDTSTFAALSHYMSAGYESMNATLRTGGDPTAADSTAITVMTDAIESGTPTSAPILVHRGISEGLPDDIRPGQILHDPGFMSTSVDKGDAELFGYGATMMELTLPTGTRAMLGNIGEDEIILQRGSSIEVDEVIESDSGRIIRGRVVQP